MTDLYILLSSLAVIFITLLVFVHLRDCITGTLEWRLTRYALAACLMAIVANAAGLIVLLAQKGL